MKVLGLISFIHESFWSLLTRNTTGDVLCVCIKELKGLSPNFFGNLFFSGSRVVIAFLFAFVFKVPNLQKMNKLCLRCYKGADRAHVMHCPSSLHQPMAVHSFSYSVSAVQQHSAEPVAYRNNSLDLNHKRSLAL